MASLLVERQSSAIAILRSRGASGRQVFSALKLAQSACAGIDGTGGFTRIDKPDPQNKRGLAR